MRTGCDPQHLFENFLSLGLDRGPIENIAAVDVHVVGHASIHLGIGGEFDRRRGLAAESRSAARGEAHHVTASGHLPGRANRVVAGVSMNTKPFSLTGSAYS